MFESTVIVQIPWFAVASAVTSLPTKFNVEPAVDKDEPSS